MNFLLRKGAYRFATLALAEHNGKNLSKNTLKLLSASQKLKDEVNIVLTKTHLLVCGQSSQ